MTIDVLQAAKSSCSHSGWRLTNLELQKILYLAQLRYKRANNGAKLIDSTFEAWDFGPVIPSLYHRLKYYGSDPIPNIFASISSPEPVLEASLIETINLLVHQSPAQLVALTHRSGGAWAKYYRPGIKGIVIPDVAIGVEAKRFSKP